MLAFLIVATFAGVLLGLRFNIFVLVLAILLAIAAITLRDIATRQSVVVILVTAFAAVVLLQIGYIVGRVLKAAIQARWPTWTLMGHRRPKSEPTKSSYRTTN
jgi:hypothetical protein